MKIWGEVYVIINIHECHSSRPECVQVAIAESDSVGDGDVFAEVVSLRVYAKFPLITLSTARVVEEVIYWEIVRAQIAIQIY